MRKWLMIVISLIVIMIGFMSVKFSNQLDNYTVQDTTFVDPIVDPIVDDSSWGVFSKHAILVDLRIIKYFMLEKQMSVRTQHL